MTETKSLQLSYLFGISEALPSLTHIDDSKVLYPAGHNLVMYNTEDHTQRFFPGMEGTLEITAYAVSPDNTFLAVGEKADQAVAFIFDLAKGKRVKSLVYAEILSRQFVSIMFHPNNEGKILATLSGDPEWTLYLWNVERQKVIASIKVASTSPVNMISYHPQEGIGGIIVTGESTLKWYKHTEGMLRQQTIAMPKKDVHVSSSYRMHTWVHDNKLLVVTEASELLLFDTNLEYKNSLIPDEPGFVIQAVQCFSRGILIGGSNGTVLVYERNPEDLKQQYQLSNRVAQVEQVDPGTSVLSMSLNPSQENYLIVVLSTMQIYSTPFSADRPLEDVRFTPMLTSFHYGAITGLDIAIRKPLAATCGSDRTVRVWNYIEHTVEIEQTFEEETFGLAFHPSAFHLAVGFSDKLRLMNVFGGRIEPFKEIMIKAWREVQFSHGGHMFAAANGHILQVFKFYTGENPSQYNFKGHTGKIRSIAWRRDDTSIITAGWDGSMFEWNLGSKGRFIQDFTRRGANFTSVAITDGGNILISCSDSLIREVKDSEIVRQMGTGGILTALALSNNGSYLIAGYAVHQEPGAIRIYDHNPLTGQYCEIPAHRLPIERIKISSDDRYVLSAGADGALAIYKNTKGNGFLNIPYSDETIITENEITVWQENIDQVSKLISDQQATGKLHYTLAMSEKQSEIQRLEDQLASDREQDNSRYGMLLQTKLDLESHYNERVRGMEDQYNIERAGMDITYAKKIKIESNRHDELSNFKGVRYEENQVIIKRLRDEHVKTVDTLEEDHRAKLFERRERLDELAKQKIELSENFELLRLELEANSELELESVRELNFNDLRTEQNRGHEARGNLKLMKKKHQGIKVDLDAMKSRVRKKLDKIEEQNRQIAVITKEKQVMVKEIRDRDKTIVDKDQRIYDLKTKNQELEKFKFVLDYKIKELKKEIIPREHEITKLKETTSEMKREISHLNTVNENLGLMVDDLNMRQSGMTKEIVFVKERHSQRTIQLSLAKNALYESMQFLGDFHRLKQSVQNVYEKYIKSDTGQEGEDDLQVNQLHQRQYLEHNINNTKEKVDKEMFSHRLDKNRIMRENVELLSEINGLRREYKILSHKKQQVDFIKSCNASTFDVRSKLNKSTLDQEAGKSVVTELRTRISELSTPRGARGRSQSVVRSGNRSPTVIRRVEFQLINNMDALSRFKIHAPRRISSSRQKFRVPPNIQDEVFAQWDFSEETNADLEVIRIQREVMRQVQWNGYRATLLRWHPDKNSNKLAATIFRMIQAERSALESGHFDVIASRQEVQQKY